MKRHLGTILKASLSAVFAMAAWAFFAIAYRHHLLYHEQYQMFLFTGEYAAGVLSMPGGVAELLSRFLIQFFLYPAIGAAIMALLLTCLQLCTWLAMRTARIALYPLSFVPAVLMWMALCDENGMPTACISLLLALLAAYGLSAIPNANMRGIAMLVATALMYMAVGPLAIIIPFAAACRVPYAIAGIVLAIACPLAAQYAFPYPLARLYYGLHYYRFPEIVPILAWCATFAAAILSLIRYIPSPKRI